jgi:4'-phosphopantetheinyl transferase EntD
LIDELLPDEVVVAESCEDLLEAELFAQEAALIENAVEKRRREFATARACAHTALQRLGLPAAAIVNGERGEPLWPNGVVGSITHCEGYRGCALAHASAIVTIGIDAEQNAPLPDGVLGEIARPEELSWLGELSRTVPAVHWDRLLFSAKESVYKAWFPLAKRWLGFEDAVVRIDSRSERVGTASGRFSARLLVDGSWGEAGMLTSLSGSWMVRDGLVLTAIALESEALTPSAPVATR